MLDIVKSSSAGVIYRAKDGTFIQVAVYDTGSVRVVMSRGEEIIQDVTMRSTDAT